MARPSKCRCICSMPKYREFLPDTDSDNGIVEITVDEYEVFRLLNLEKKTQSECAERMNISRPTVTRINEIASEKIADALVHGKRIHIGGGDVEVCLAPKPECAGEPHCCHKLKEKD